MPRKLKIRAQVGAQQKDFTVSEQRYKGRKAYAVYQQVDGRTVRVSRVLAKNNDLKSLSSAVNKWKADLSLRKNVMLSIYSNIQNKDINKQTHTVKRYHTDTKKAMQQIDRIKVRKGDVKYYNVSGTMKDGKKVAVTMKIAGGMSRKDRREEYAKMMRNFYGVVGESAISRRREEFRSYNTAEARHLGQSMVQSNQVKDIRFGSISWKHPSGLWREKV